MKLPESLSSSHTRDTVAAIVHSNPEGFFLLWALNGYIHDANNSTTVTINNSGNSFHRFDVRRACDSG
jgi:hypothetical protein